MEVEGFKEISIRGRVAYGIRCLESMIVYFDEDEEKWKSLLDVLWKYTNEDYLDEWHYRVAEYTPDSILDDPYDEDDVEYISYEEYNFLRKLYSSAKTCLLKVIDLIFYVGTIELYGKVVNYGKECLNQLEKILELMELNNVPLPNIEPFKKYSFDQENGWGERFSREDS